MWCPKVGILRTTDPDRSWACEMIILRSVSEIRPTDNPDNVIRCGAHDVFRGDSISKSSVSLWPFSRICSHDACCRSGDTVFEVLLCNIHV